MKNLLKCFAKMFAKASVNKLGNFHLSDEIKQCPGITIK